MAARAGAGCTGGQAAVALSRPKERGLRLWKELERLYGLQELWGLKINDGLDCRAYPGLQRTIQA